MIGTVVGAVITDSWNFGIFGDHKHNAAEDLSVAVVWFTDLINPVDRHERNTADGGESKSQKHISLNIIAAGDQSTAGQYTYFTVMITNDGNVVLDEVQLAISLPNQGNQLASIVPNSATASIQPNVVFIDDYWAKDKLVNFGYLNVNQSVEFHFAIRMNDDVEHGTELRTAFFVRSTQTPQWKSWVFRTNVGDPLPNTVVEPDTLKST